MGAMGLWIFVIVLPIYQQFLHAIFFQPERKYVRSSSQLVLATKNGTRTILFFDVIPAAKGFTCVCSVASRRCGKTIAVKRRTKANAIRRGLSICPPSHPSFAPLLEEYARTCLCSRNIHRQYDEAIATIVAEWSEDLRRAHHSILREGDIIELHVPGSFMSDPITTSQQSAILNLDSALNVHLEDDSALDTYKALFDAPPNDVELAYLAEAGIEHDVLTPMRSKNASWSFQPYIRKSQKTLEEVIWAPLGTQDRDPGHLYAFTRAGDERYIKIGYTADIVASRMEGWGNDCKYTPIVRHESQAMVPNAKRVEKLVHTDLELRSLRRRESWCRTNTECSKSHGEWFEIPEVEATHCIEYWSKWMTIHKPYDSNGHLKDQWIVTIHLPQAHLEACPDARRFVSDSLGKSWLDAEVKKAQASRTASDPTAAVYVSTEELETIVATQTTRCLPTESTGSPQHGHRAPRTPRHTPLSNIRSRRGLDVSVSEPILPSAAMMDVDVGSDIENTPSGSVLSRGTRTSSRKSTPTTDASSSANTPTRSRRKSTPSKLPCQSTLDPAPTDEAQAEADDLGSKMYPILIESDTDEPPVLPPRNREPSDERNSLAAVQTKRQLGTSLLEPSPESRGRSSSSTATLGEPGQTHLFRDLPERLSNLDFAEQCKSHRPPCLNGNSTPNLKCNGCQYCAPQFTVPEELDLPTTHLEFNARPLRPAFLAQVPASDPVVPLARDDFETKEDERTRYRGKAKTRRKSQANPRSVRNKDGV